MTTKGIDVCACPSCRNDDVRCHGQIPGSNTFAGRQLDRVLPGGMLWSCKKCQLVFRCPRLSKEDLDDLYRQGLSENWPEQAQHRADWMLAKKIIADFPEIRRVLDVGCFDGKLLESLGPHYEKLGVEIHAEAARRAEMRNVRIIGHDFSELTDHQGIADAVLAMDVIEHSEDPFDFLNQLVATVKPGGFILIGTGNTDAFSWKFMGSAYWYCHIAEHISFINPRWADYASHRLGLKRLGLYSFSHGTNKLGTRAKEAILNILYRLSPSLFALLRQFGAGRIDVARFKELGKVPPYWLSANDHILFVFQKYHHSEASCK